jgi:hypothetical protein
MAETTEEIDINKNEKTMGKLLYIFTSIILFFFAAMSNAYAIGNQFKQERYAFVATWIIFAALMLITYLIWKRKSKASLGQHAAKFKTKTYEIMSHGKRMVITKKINIEPNKK